MADEGWLLAKREECRPDKEKLIDLIRTFALPMVLFKSDDAGKIYTDLIKKIRVALQDAFEEAETL
jgi:hypothetical protein